MSDLRLGIDVGGTFTDLVALVDGEVVTAKVPSTPKDQARGMLRAIEVAGVAAGAVAVQDGRAAPLEHPGLDPFWGAFGRWAAESGG